MIIIKNHFPVKDFPSTSIEKHTGNTILGYQIQMLAFRASCVYRKFLPPPWLVHVGQPLHQGASEDPTTEGWHFFWRHFPSFFSGEKKACQIFLNVQGKQDLTLKQNGTADQKQNGCFQKLGGKPPKWMVKIMENPY